MIFAEATLDDLGIAALQVARLHDQWGRVTSIARARLQDGRLIRVQVSPSATFNDVVVTVVRAMARGDA